jgi:hypothetical protein
MRSNSPKGGKGYQQHVGKERPEVARHQYPGRFGLQWLNPVSRNYRPTFHPQGFVSIA